MLLTVVKTELRPMDAGLKSWLHSACVTLGKSLVLLWPSAVKLDNFLPPRHVITRVASYYMLPGVAREATKEEQVPFEIRVI